MAGGKMLRKVEYVAQLGRLVGLAKTWSLPQLVGKVQGLLESASISWSIRVKGCMLYAFDEVLWSLSGVPRNITDLKLLGPIKINVEIAVGLRLVIN